MTTLEYDAGDGPSEPQPVQRARREVVLVVHLDQAAITAALDACLLRDTTFRPRAWAGLDDPFPAWGAAAA